MRERCVKRPLDEQKMQAALRAVEQKQLPHMLCVSNMLLHGIEDVGGLCRRVPPARQGPLRDAPRASCRTCADIGWF